MPDDNSLVGDFRQEGIQTISTEQYLAHYLPEFNPFILSIGEIPIQIPTSKGTSSRTGTFGGWLEDINSPNQNGHKRVHPNDVSSIADQMRGAFPEDPNHILPSALEAFSYFGIDLRLRDNALKRRLTLLQHPIRSLYGLISDYPNLDPRVLGNMGDHINTDVFKDRRTIRNSSASFVNYFLTLNSDYAVPPDIIVEMYKILMHRTGLSTLSLLMDGAIMQGRSVPSIRSPKPGQLEGLIRGLTAEVHGVSALMKRGFKVLPVEYNADRNGLDYLACDIPVNIGGRLVTPLHAVQIKGRPYIETPVVITEEEMIEILNSKAVKYRGIDIRSEEMPDMYALLRRSGNYRHIVKRKRTSKSNEGIEYTDASPIWVYAPTLI